MAEKEIGKPLLSVQNVVHGYGGQPVLNDISVTLHEGDRVGLIGRNGSGKSTLMRILAGAMNPDNGLVTRTKGIRVALLSQSCALPREKTVQETLYDAAEDARAMVAQYHAVVDKLSQTPGSCWEHTELQQECDALQHALDASDGWNWDQDIKRVSVALALPPANRTLSLLSGGELRRVDLATKLIQHPDVLLLDEPTNHIDTRSVEWIERFLERYEGCCVLVTHDRYFLDRVVNRIVELEFNKLYSFPGSYARFLEYKAVVEDSIARAEQNRQALIRRELAWLRRGAKARSTKQKARIQRAEDIIESGPPQKHREFVFEIPEPQSLSKTILEARHLYHRYDDQWLFKDFSLLMQKHMRVGIVGPNGSGKTTLLRVLMGTEEPCKGRIILGDATDFLYVDQAHEEMRPEQTILNYVSDGSKTVEVNRRRIYIPAYLEKFLFDKDSVDMPLGNLSGGERNRLDLLKKLLRGGNFLVLDEPTNDLDLYTLRVLEETIEAFDGCALIVSHDRYFLNRICTHMLVFEEEGVVTQIVGNYDDYLLYQERRKEEKREERQRQTAQKRAETAEAKPAVRRLTWKEKKELEEMEESILEAEEAVSCLEEQIQVSGFYEQDHQTVNTTLQALETAKKHVEALYARWEALAELQ